MTLHKRINASDTYRVDGADWPWHGAADAERERRLAAARVRDRLIYAAIAAIGIAGLILALAIGG